MDIVKKLLQQYDFHGCSHRKTPWKRRLGLLLVYTVVLVPLLVSHELAFDTSRGSVSTLSMEQSDTPANPDNYLNGSNYSNKPGYLGRLLYWGEGVEVQCVNGGPDATGTMFNRFYYVMDNNDGSTTNSIWREYFLVARVRGVRHDGKIRDVQDTNVVLEHPGQTLEFPGAGTGQLSGPGAGYDEDGNPGIYDGSNAYKYQYPWEMVFADLSVIRTQNNSLIWPYYYYYFTSRLRFVGSGVDLALSLTGTTRWAGWYSQIPQSYSFTVDRIVGDPIPYTSLVQHNSFSNVLPVGIVRFQGFDQNLGGHVWYASNPGGTQADFRFSSTIAGIVQSFPYELVYQPVFPVGTARRITSVSEKFDSNIAYLTVVALGTQMYQQYLEGQLGIYVPANPGNTQHPPGTYSSTVYCCLEVD